MDTQKYLLFLYNRDLLCISSQVFALQHHRNKYKKELANEKFLMAPSTKDKLIEFYGEQPWRSQYRTNLQSHGRCNSVF